MVNAQKRKTKPGERGMILDSNFVGKGRFLAELDYF